MSTSTARGGLNIYNALDYICKSGSFHMWKVYIAVMFVFFNELIQIIHFEKKDDIYLTYQHIFVIEQNKKHNKVRLKTCQLFKEEHGLTDDIIPILL